jgi:uncharacterized protein (TIGR02302 family)
MAGQDRTADKAAPTERFAKRIALARLALFWEQAWPALWPAVGAAGLFIALSLAGTWQVVEGWYHLAALALFAALTLTLLWCGLVTLRAPDVDQGRRRLEHASGLDHRPLAALNDGLASGRGNAQTQALWRAYRRRALKSLTAIRVGWPRTNLAARDPLAIRAAIVLALFIGVMAAGAEAPARLINAFQPDLLGPVVPAQLEAWITPPEYTGRPPVLLKAPPTPGADAIIKPTWAAVPDGSTLFARVHGGRGGPALRLGDKTTAFEPVDARNHQINQVLSSSGLVEIMQNERPLAAWWIEVTPDEAPVAAFTDLPAPTSRLSLKISYLASDDYGVTGLRLEIRGPNGAIENIELAPPRHAAANFRSSTYRNFTPHRWAGLKVSMTLVAEDAVGNTGRSDAVEVVLPARIFEHPVAKAVIEQRKRLAGDPAAAAVVSRALMIIGAFPQEFNYDFVVTLALRTASQRLVLSPGDESVGKVIDLLWDTALRIEDGVVSIAEANFRNAEQALMDALDRGADDEEINRLIEQLRQAMSRFFQALAEQLQRDAEAGKLAESPIDPNDMTLRSEDLQRLLDRAQELARMGAKEAARELLSQLRDILENLRVGARTSPMSPQMREGQRALKGLSDLMRRQQELLDKTFRESQRRQGQKGANQGQVPTAAEQEELRRALGDIMRRLGDARGSIPKPLGKAERAMRGAGRALEQGRPGEAVPSQSQALEHLRAGVEKLARAMMAERGRGAALTRRRPLPGQQRTDPLGRPIGNPGADDGADVKVPDQAAMQRARKVLQELHRRSAEPARPPTERRYIDRLLRRF